MNWLRRIFGREESSSAPERKGEPEPMEGPAPGVSEIFSSAPEDRNWSVLDLGPGNDHNLRTYNRCARRVRFSSFLQTLEGEGWGAALSTIPAPPEPAFDLVFAWDVLDRLPAEVRPQLLARLLDVSSPRAHLHTVWWAPEEEVTYPLRFSLTEIDRIRSEQVGPPQRLRAPLLPTEVGRLLAPFRVKRSFTLRRGLREYVAVREPDAPGS